MNDGTRTHDDRDHNPGLYQLSYVHHFGKQTYASRPLDIRDCNETPTRCQSHTIGWTENQRLDFFRTVKRPPPASSTCRYGAPGRTRTCNLRLRRPLLYPVELRARRSSLTECRKIPADFPVAPPGRVPTRPVLHWSGRGIELSTSSPQSWRSTKLSYTPIVQSISIGFRCPLRRPGPAKHVGANRNTRIKKRVPKHPRITGAPGEIRTPDHQVRSLVLYPAELRAREAELFRHTVNFVKRNIWRRERDSNPREGYKPSTPLAGEPLQPLGHLSEIQCCFPTTS